MGAGGVEGDGGDWGERSSLRPRCSEGEDASNLAWWMRKVGACPPPTQQGTEHAFGGLAGRMPGRLCPPWPIGRSCPTQGCWPPFIRLPSSGNRSCRGAAPGFTEEVAAGAVAKADPATLMLTPEPDLPKSGELIPRPDTGLENNGRSNSKETGAADIYESGARLSGRSPTRIGPAHAIRGRGRSQRRPPN